jgi:AraC-like DNA-binding protein
MGDSRSVGRLGCTVGAAGTVSYALFDEVCRAAAGLGYEVAASREHRERGRVPLQELHRQLAHLRQSSGDPDVGLRLGRALNPRGFSVTGYLIMAGPTLMQALPRIARYQRLVADGIVLNVAESPDRFDLAWKFESVQPSPEFIDLLMSGVRYFGAWLLGTEPPLDRVRFAYPPRACTALHRDIFGSDLNFGAAESGFSLARRWFEQQIRTGDHSLVPWLETYAEQLLALLRSDCGLAAISEIMLGLIPQGDLDISAVAAELGRSPRSLQRTLRQNGTSFQRLLQELRLRLAHEYFGNAQLSLRQIASRLGYREQSSFCHAYRQWTGHSPSDARKARS